MTLAWVTSDLNAPYSPNRHASDAMQLLSAAPFLLLFGQFRRESSDILDALSPLSVWHFVWTMTEA